MSYVLIVLAMLSWQGKAVSFQEFHTLEACEGAKHSIAALLKKEGAYILPMDCVPR